MKEKWLDIKLIGQGGNGKVYRVRRSDGKLYAIKILNRTKIDKAYKRFKDEIKALKRLKDTEGVINIIDYHLPQGLSKNNKAYYVMPLALPLEEYLRAKTYTQFYSIILKLAYALVQIHENDIAHRDIKPENLLVVDGEPVFSDFGLAHFPKKGKVSNSNEKIGAKWTIAAEMKRISSTSEFKKADIYSFAKTIWILITGQKSGFEGQYIPKSSISIDNFIDLKVNYPKIIGEWKYESIVLLEKLMVDATNNDPDKRPDSITFFERLSEWYNTSVVFGQRNVYEWEYCLSRIFPVSIPESCSWTKSKEIHEIFQMLSEEYDQLNYAFFPEHGGTDLTNIKFAKEKNCLILNDYYVVNPYKLTFESMGDLDFSYFMLELNTLSPTGDTILNEIRENVYLNNNGEYVSIYDSQSKEMIRYLKGSFVITRKTSFLNQIRGDFDGHFGIHHEKSSSEYRKFVDNLLRLYYKNLGLQKDVSLTG